MDPRKPFKCKYNQKTIDCFFFEDEELKNKAIEAMYYDIDNRMWVEQWLQRNGVLDHQISPKIRPKIAIYEKGFGGPELRTILKPGEYIVKSYKTGEPEKAIFSVYPHTDFIAEYDIIEEDKGV